MSDTCTNNDEMLKTAIGIQQTYYELLPDWYEYKFGEHRYIKQTIGFALYGPPEIQECNDSALPASKIDQDTEVFDITKYDEMLNKIIDTIFQKVLKYGSNNKSFSIYLGVIYNVIFFNKKPKNTNCKDNASNQDSDEILALPIFKIRKHGEEFDIWYIDINGRVYKSWSDYTCNNTLPACTMILPVNGIYQADPTQPVTETESTVWVQAINSPATNTSKKIVSVLDSVSTVLGVGSAIGLGAAAALTPVGPVLAAAGIAGGSISGLWTIGRCSQQLVDLGTHEESIAPTTKKAFPAWLGIAGSALGIGATGGNILLARAIARGSSVNQISRIAFNSLIISNLTVNGVGVVYKGCSLIKKYKETREVEFAEVFMFATHVLFFSNTVLSTKLAGELVRSRGNFFEELTYNLRKDRLTEQCNRAKKTANLGKEENAINNGIIRQIRKFHYISDACKAIWLNSKSSFNFVDGKVTYNNIVLIDPVQFVGSLITTGGYFRVPIEELLMSSLQKENGNILARLKCLLAESLRNISTECNNTPNLPAIHEFNDILEELKNVDNAHEILPKILSVATNLLQYYNDPLDLLFIAVHFVWEYMKENLRTSSIAEYPRSQVHRMLFNIITTIIDVFDNVVEQMYRAFYMYKLQDTRSYHPKFS